MKGSRLVPVVVALAVGGIAVGVGLVRSGDDAASVATTEPAAVRVEADSIYEFTSLTDMVLASDAVIRGQVVSAERGRLVGDPGSGGVISRVLTIQVDAVLAGTAGSTVLVEEEGWLPDGTPLIVNGVPPTKEGDDGIFFLDTIDDPEFPGSLIINSQGRYLVADDGTLIGGDQSDALVQTLEAETPDQLTEQIRGI